MTYFEKRCIDTIVTGYALLIVCLSLINVYTFIYKQADALRQTGINLTESLIMIPMDLGSLAALFGALVSALAILYVFISGNGLLYRRVDEGDTLLDEDRNIVHTFTKRDLVPRFSPMFRARKLRCH